jgi:hypothetical protein
MAREFNISSKKNEFSRKNKCRIEFFPPISSNILREAGNYLGFSFKKRKIQVGGSKQAVTFKNAQEHVEKLIFFIFRHAR